MENNVKLSGSDSGNDTGGSVGNVSGTSGNGSDRGIDGSGGNANGSGGSADGSGNGSASIGSDNAESGIASDNGNQNDVRRNLESVDSADSRDSRSERQRQRRPVRLGDIRNRDSDADTEYGGSGTAAQELDSEPVIRLGARKQGRPKTKVDTDSVSVDGIKWNDTKDIIQMFVESIFEIPAITLKQDFWRLNKDESKMLTDAIGEYVKSMPKSKSSWLMNFIKENLPLVNLCMVGFFIVSDRIQASIALAQVTKAGRAFDLKSNQTNETQTQSAGVRTPLDAMFH